MNQHACLKCKTAYQDNDVDDYFCAPCIAERKQIAKQIDAQFANRPRVQAMTDLQKYDELAQQGRQGSVNGHSVKFVNANLL